MTEPGTGAKRVRGVADRQGRAAVAASLLAALLIGGYFATDTGGEGGLPAAFLINAVVLAAAFWFPALRLGSVREVVAGGAGLVVWLLAWTLVWDLATSGIVGGRDLFADWWLVYPTGVLVLGGLLVLHGAVVHRVGAAPPDD